MYPAYRMHRLEERERERERENIRSFIARYDQNSLEWSCEYLFFGI